MECGNASLLKLSRLISRSLCLSGSGRYATLLARNKTLVLDYLYYSASNELEMFEGGSVAEGTLTSGSDADRMIVVPDVVVEMSEEKKDDLKKTGHVFLLDTRACNPGYARLHPLHLADKNNPLFDGYGVDIQEILEETTEGVFLSSEKFADFFISVPHHHGLSTAYYRHGPCATAEHVDTHGFIEGKPGISKETDIAHALVCVEWPIEAKEWITRRRLHNWPTQSMIKIISNKKCYVVPIGNPESEYHSLEWRISYLLSERELVWSFNDTQLNCYFILKKLHKLYFDKLAPDQLSSYHMKTTVFWLSEEKGLSMWFQENLLVCVETCLDRLYDCIQKRQLHHYFNCHVNLFGHKFQNDHLRKQILEKIQEVRTNISANVLNCLPPEWKWPTMWEDLSSETCSFAKLGNEFEILENAFPTTRKANEAYHLYRVMFNLLLQVTTDYLDARWILRQLTAFENNPPVGIYSLFIEMTKIFLDLRFAMAYFREITVHEDEEFQTYIESQPISSKDMTVMVSHASRMDGMSGELYLATIYQFLGDYSMSTTIVNRVLDKHRYLIYSGWCSTYRSIHLTGDGLSKQVPGIKLQGEEGRTHAAYDVIFSYKDVHCVPYPLKFECALAEFDSDDFIVMHPCIYANFLLCYGQYASKNFSTFKNNLKILQMSVDESKGGLERHHALNILAYCYLLNGNFVKAFEYFKESFQETEHSKVSNAAAFHIAIILLNRFENSSMTKIQTGP
ncbi:uncharacterized protein LOC123562660 [Mercenaria mercenaria]|uniref:uncharacterized protein LOC123562660 n=1 Tax=Mercenaria mercenaria TaxID=6596 RepID=UPI00234EC8AC|nr:uncharacterized protein LOC123562660 [Mercenaria mercenaria]